MMHVLKNIGTLATCRAGGAQQEIHEISHGALVWKNDTILWVGAEKDLPAEYKSASVHDAKGNLVTPGLIDCHTHLAFGGWRSDEFEMRILGKSYLEIEQSGGGIASTVAKTRAASFDELKARAHDFLIKMRKLGVTTVECKSGYGLNPESELKLLRVYKALKTEQPLTIVPTFLGAHTFPPEHRNSRAEYIKLVIEKMIPAVAAEGLAEFCDIFVESSAFSVDEARTIFAAAKASGLRPKIHADQFGDSGGAKLAAEVGAISADHLEFTGDDGIKSMIEKDVVAVLLPFASLTTNQKPVNARRLIEKGATIAIATDFNPGSAPSYHLPLAMHLSCTLSRMTPAEVLKGATINAAKAINRESSIGSLEPGKKADFIIVDAPTVNHWMYHFRENVCLETFKNGSAL